MGSNQERPNIKSWEKVAIAVCAIAFLAVLMWACERPIQSPPPRAATPAPPVTTTLHDAGDGVTCWVLRRGETILGNGCLR